MKNSQAELVVDAFVFLFSLLIIYLFFTIHINNMCAIGVHRDKMLSCDCMSCPTY